MGIFTSIWSIFSVAFKRLLSQRGLMLAATLGLAASVALSLSIPLYSEAVYYRIFESTVTNPADNGGYINRPPFSFVFLYSGAWAGNTQWEDVLPVDQYISNEIDTALNLPQEMLTRYIRTRPYPIFTAQESNFERDSARLFNASFGTMNDLADHIHVIDGTLPGATATLEDGPVSVMVHQLLADEMGLQAGEDYIAYFRAETETGSLVTIQIPLRIAGIWTPIDSAERYWIFNPNQLKDVLMVAEETFGGAISYVLPDEIYSATWFLIMDGTDVNVGNAKALAARISQVEIRVDTILPATKLSVSPLDDLLSYYRSASLLTILLYAFSVPIIGLILAFIGLVAGLAVERQRNEIAVLRSRGATLWQILNIVLLESIILGLVALAISAPVAMLIARLIGQTRSFLNFSAGADLRVGLSSFTLQAGLITLVVALIARIVPALGAARHTIVSYKLERARMLKPPWWQRAWLDLLLFIPTAYGIYQLRQQGALVALDPETVTDPFQNPLLFILPALTLFALTLFILRLIPPSMRAIAWIVGHTRSVGLLLAARHLSRTPGSYSTPLILLILTLSLSAYTASLAQTLDNHLYDQVGYSIGADISFKESGAARTSSAYGAPQQTDDDEPQWMFIPITQYLTIPGIEAAARVGKYAAQPIVAGTVLDQGVFMGVDRVDFPGVAYWRNDFAGSDLGSMMNALALQPNGVLVPRTFQQQHGLSGDEALRVLITAYGQRVELSMNVVGTFELFPTWYPDSDGTLMVGNLEYIYEQVGSRLPYEVWVNLAPDADLEYLINEGLESTGAGIGRVRDVGTEVVTEQLRPERQGLFGLLSIGFGAAAVLTVLGFLLYALFSFRRRFIELGVLRAAGLSSGQMTSFLAWELAFLIVIGGGAGTALGAWISNLFIPYLQIGVAEAERIPP
ncbi:MAG: FtsX-like permease family protein, partial [Anaerolineales bacterium]|nr:FtsX-like permease family protein [Anaerolineales bacterium]